MRILRSHEDIEIAWLKLEDLDEDIEIVWLKLEDLAEDIEIACVSPLV